MKITVNGKPLEVVEATTVDQLMHQLEYDSARVAVALNLEFVPRSAYGETKLHESDELEIVTAVSGG